MATNSPISHEKKTNYVGKINDFDVSTSPGEVRFHLDISMDEVCSGLSNFIVPITATGHFSGTCNSPGEGRITMLIYEYHGPDAPRAGINTFDINPGDIECKDGGGVTSTPPPNIVCFEGTENKDNLIGTSGNDCIDGGKGNDKIAGLSGNDLLTGGKGADLFQCGAGNDKITDFNPAEGDKKTNDCEQF